MQLPRRLYQGGQWLSGGKMMALGKWCGFGSVNWRSGHVFLLKGCSPLMKNTIHNKDDWFWGLFCCVGAVLKCHKLTTRKMVGIQFDLHKLNGLTQVKIVVVEIFILEPIAAINSWIVWPKSILTKWNKYMSISIDIFVVANQDVARSTRVFVIEYFIGWNDQDVENHLKKKHSTSQESRGLFFCCKKKKKLALLDLFIGFCPPPLPRCVSSNYSQPLFIKTSQHGKTTSDTTLPLVHYFFESHPSIVSHGDCIKSWLLVPSPINSLESTLPPRFCISSRFN